MEIMATTKYPSRIRYEESHPSVTFRVSREDYERLDRIRQEWGWSFRDIIMYGAGLAERDMEAEEKRINEASMMVWEQACDWSRKETLSSVEIGTCSGCGEAIEWDLTNPHMKSQIDDIVSSTSICHNECCRGRNGP